MFILTLDLIKPPSPEDTFSVIQGALLKRVLETSQMTYSSDAIPLADLGGSRDAPPSPGRPNSFDFKQFLGNFGKIICWRPPPGSWCPLLEEILVLPLNTIYDIYALVSPKRKGN